LSEMTCEMRCEMTEMRCKLSELSKMKCALIEMGCEMTEMRCELSEMNWNVKRIELQRQQDVTDSDHYEQFSVQQHLFSTH
jgi:predicted nuclease with TOPRIM domain